MARVKSRPIRPEMTSEQVSRRADVLAAKQAKAPTPAEIRRRAFELRQQILAGKEAYVEVDRTTLLPDRDTQDMFCHQVLFYCDKILTAEEVEKALGIGLWALAEEVRKQSGSVFSEDDGEE